MKKLGQLKKKLFKTAIIAMIATVAFGALFYGINSLHESAKKEKSKIENELRQKRSKVAQLEQKFNIYESSFSAYNEISAALDQGAYNLDISNAQKVLDILRQRHRISNLSVNITPQERFGGDNAQHVGFEPVFREVTLTFAALSDAHVYEFTRKIAQHLKGYIRFTRVDISRSRPLTDTILQEVRRGSTPTIADVSITFLWIGINKLPEDNKGGTNAR